MLKVLAAKCLPKLDNSALLAHYSVETYSVKTAFIYGLRCPLTGAIRYVGKCENPKERLSVHLCTKERCRRGNWVRSLKAQGLRPAFEILAKVPDDNWEFWERSYIRAYRCLGFDLVNGTDGGDGVEMTAEIRAKISATLTGKKKSSEHCANISKAKRGKKQSPENVAKTSAAKLGKKPRNNTSGFVGVRWDTHNERWRAEIPVKGNRVRLGSFKKLEDAVFVRNLAFDKYYGNHEST